MGPKLILLWCNILYFILNGDQLLLKSIILENNVIKIFEIIFMWKISSKLRINQIENWFSGFLFLQNHIRIILEKP